MPTELPDFTAEFALKSKEQISKYNEQQRVLHSLRLELSTLQSPPANPAESQLRELREQLDAANRLCTEQNQQLDLALANADKESEKSQQQLRDLKGQIESLRNQSATRIGQLEGPAEFAALRRELDELKKTNARLEYQLGQPNGKLSESELAKKLKEIRKKISTYSTRLIEMHGFELATSSRLTSQQLRSLVDALDKELMGMMERYQALSRWKENDGRDDN